MNRGFRGEINAYIQWKTQLEGTLEQVRAGACACDCDCDECLPRLSAVTQPKYPGEVLNVYNLRKSADGLADSLMIQ